jgi:hypothetical protein
MRLSSSRIILGSLLALAQFACGSDSGSTDDTGEIGGTSAIGTTQPASTGGQGSTNTSATGGATAKSTTANLGGGTASSAGGASSTGGAATVGGTTGTGGSSAQTTSSTRGGTSSTGGTSNTGGTSSTGGSTSTGGTTATNTSGLAKFSFFVTSQTALLALAGNSNGFGGDLRYGMTDGLSGADKICAAIAEQSMPGSSAKQWRAFLSVTAGPNGTAVNAIDRVGTGPWYDRLGRLVANTKQDLLSTRPATADTAIKNDLPNETGTPNHYASGTPVDNHDVLTGTNTSGGIGTTSRANTCNDWTSSTGSTGKPQIGHSWPRTATSAMNWMSDHTAPGCAAGVNTGSQNGTGSCVGCAGGYGAIYCFALSP